MRHIWSVYCSKASIDQETNSVSLFEVIEALTLEAPPDGDFPVALPFPSTLVTLWMRSDPDVAEMGQQQLRFLDPEGNAMGTFLGKVDLETTVRSRVLARLNAIQLGGPGIHRWEVSFRAGEDDDWEEVCRIPVELTVVPSEEEAAGEEG